MLMKNGFPARDKAHTKAAWVPLQASFYMGFHQKVLSTLGKVLPPSVNLSRKFFKDHFSYLILLKLALSLTITDGSTEPDCFSQRHMTHPVAPRL